MRSELREELTRRFQALLAEEAFDLWDLEVASQSGRLVLRVFVDRPPGIAPGVTVGECSYWNKKLGRYLEAENLLRGSFALEVGSPGIERALSRPEHSHLSGTGGIRLPRLKDGGATSGGASAAATPSSSRRGSGYGLAPSSGCAVACDRRPVGKAASRNASMAAP
jgi:hypothetical protein